MATNYVPAGYHQVQPYLIQRDCAAAMMFYQRVFGAIERLCLKGPDGRIGHAELQFGDCCIMMADESPKMEAFSPNHYGGSPMSLMLYAEDCDAVYRRALEAGAISQREPADQPYGERMAGVTDPFGYRWFIATRIKDMTREELEKL